MLYQHCWHVCPARRLSGCHRTVTPVLLKALPRDEQLQMHCITLALGPTCDLSFCDRHVGIHCSLLFSASVLQIEAQRLGGGAEVLHHYSAASVQMLNCTKPEQGQGSQTWCSFICSSVPFTCKPTQFLLQIHNLESLSQVGFFQKEIADSLWGKASELISCHTNTAGSGPKTTVESWLIWQC